jgi:hypothetical protein
VLRPGSGFVARSLERGRVRRACDQALAGQGGLVVVFGEAGIGKSQLVQAVVGDVAGRFRDLGSGLCLTPNQRLAELRMQLALVCPSERHGCAPDGLGGGGTGGQGALSWKRSKRILARLGGAERRSVQVDHDDRDPRRSSR